MRTLAAVSVPQSINLNEGASLDRNLCDSYPQVFQSCPPSCNRRANDRVHGKLDVMKSRFIATLGVEAADPAFRIGQDAEHGADDAKHAKSEASAGHRGRLSS